MRATIFPVSHRAPDKIVAISQRGRRSRGRVGLGAGTQKRHSRAPFPRRLLTASALCGDRARARRARPSARQVNGDLAGPPMDPAAGTLVARRFRLVREVGRGSMGTVWLADHETLGLPCAVKFATVDAERDPAYRERFEREA